MGEDDDEHPYVLMIISVPSMEGLKLKRVKRKQMKNECKSRRRPSNSNQQWKPYSIKLIKDNQSIN